MSQIFFYTHTMKQRKRYKQRQDLAIYYEMQKEESYGIEVSRLDGTPEDLVEDLLCGICKRIIVKGELCHSCMQIFCGPCITSYNAKNGKCPQDHEYVKKVLIPLQERLLKKLRIKCKNLPNGCEDILTYNDLEEHESTCGYQLVTCTCAGCTKQILKKAQAEHLAVCPHYILDCKFCGKKFKRLEIQNHEEGCEERPVTCPNKGCSFNAPQREYLKHKEACPYELLECMWCKEKIIRASHKMHQENCDYKLCKCKGCKESIYKKDLAGHEEKCEEMEIACPQCSCVMPKRIKNTHSCIQSLNKRLIFLEKALSATLCDDCIGKRNDCEICGKIICIRCRVKKCKGCFKPCCKNCVTRCRRCEVFVCNTCVSKECSFCLDKFCKKCANRICSQCEKKCCNNCAKKNMKKCNRCQKDSCGECTTVCCGCQKGFCGECTKVCRGCQKDFCGGCTTVCCGCQKGFCGECTTVCCGCQKGFCGECTTVCCGCQGSFCKKCLEEKGTKCSLCKNPFCNTCSTKGLNKCSGCKKLCCSKCILSDCIGGCTKAFCKECSINCIECGKICCSECTSTKIVKCRSCKKPYCKECTNLLVNCKECKKRIKLKGVKWDKFLNGKEKVTDIPVAYVHTCNGGAAMDIDKGIIWSIHGNCKGMALFKRNITTKSKESFGLPFNIKGSYPVFDNEEYIYVNSSEEPSGNNQLARVHTVTGKVEKLQSAPNDFQRCTNGVFRKGILYKLNTSNYLMSYDPKTNTWKNNIFNVGTRANMLADVRDEDGIFFFRENNDLQLYSVSKNAIVRTFASHGEYNLDVNANCAIIEDAEDQSNCFILNLGDRSGYPPKAINLKENTWKKLPWTPDNGSGGFLIYDGEKLWNSVYQQKYWRQITFEQLLISSMNYPLTPPILQQIYFPNNKQKLILQYSIFLQHERTYLSQRRNKQHPLFSST
eukprot:TRINITY_DN593_c0_g1_i1.p1 TRINITY_DN593_c0_g1~~TRINITY_DN593_c0_g1_i1.p1  ORF type:complete len:940 (+),score=38.03 TRINITY_DN593_c0_g1_i1:4351-7170(+)